jgi:hypothetical protein
MIRSALLASCFFAASTGQIACGAYIAGPVQWTVADGGNDHYYALFGADDINWTSARDAAAGLNFMGSQGHLVTITSAGESGFLETNFGSYIGDPNAPGSLFPPVPGIRAWIGLSDVVTEGNFQWVTGEAFSYSNWAPPEPNNLGNEDFVWLWRRDFGAGPLWSWNDAANSSGPADGFFVEFAGPFVEPVPEPASLVLFGLGTLGVVVGAVHRRRH